MEEQISKRAAIEVIFSEPLYESGMKKRDADEVVPAIYEKIKSLPPAQPERKKGRWIKVNGHTAINCSACHHCSWSLSFEDMVQKFNFCPNCGADMRAERRGG